MTPTKQKKSHFGCQSCKSRKIKCDETKPACLKCLSRRQECVYNAEWSRRGRTKPPSSEASTPALPGPFDSVECHVFEKATPADLELRLLHQWSVSTWKTISPAEYGRYLQVDVPIMAFRHRLLLDSVLLLSAAHAHYLSPTQESPEIVHQYKLKTLASIHNELAAGLTVANGEYVAWSGALLAAYWLTCDTDTEFTGVHEGFRPLFIGMANMFVRLLTQTGQPSILLRHRPVFEMLPSGDRFLVHLEKIYQQCPSQHLEKHGKVYAEVALLLAQIAEKLVDFPVESVFIRFACHWILYMPEVYVDLVNDMDPAALTYLALFFKMMSCRQEWYLGTYAWLHYERVCAKVPADWRHFLDFSVLQFPLTPLSHTAPGSSASSTPGMPGSSPDTPVVTHPSGFNGSPSFIPINASPTMRVTSEPGVGVKRETER